MSHQPTKTNRADDEYLLELIGLRCLHGSGQIARAYGIASARVRNLCNRVLSDDLKHSGEAEATVRAGYWKD